MNWHRATALDGPFIDLSVPVVGSKSRKPIREGKRKMATRFTDLGSQLPETIPLPVFANDFFYRFKELSGQLIDAYCRQGQISFYLD